MQRQTSKMGNEVRFDGRVAVVTGAGGGTRRGDGR